MKNYAKVLVFAAIVALIVVPAQAVEVSNDMCTLISKMQGVFKILRVLAFVGAGFYMAGWAWEYIKGGDAKMDDIKKKGIGLLVGFALLFAIGVIITFLLGATTGPNDTVLCADKLKDGWN